MKHYDKKWKLKQNDASAIKTLMDTLGISEVMAQLLAVRGIKDGETAKEFLKPSVERLLDPFLLKGMKEAILRIQQAVETGESICIYGDYDVDGITSVSLLTRFFRWLGHPVQYYIPDRMEEGYGINKEGLRRIRETGCTLVISVDCGITAVEPVEYAKNLGLDVIITDHHEPHDEIPAAIAVIDAKQEDCPYPDKNLSGVGIAFKLAQGIAPKVLESSVIEELFQIAALGTVADIVPMMGENRILVRYGLDALKNNPVPGVKALIQTAGLDENRISTGQIGFVLAPRINAAGRIDQPQKGVELLTTDSAVLAKELAEELSQLNDERQQIERALYEQAVEQIEGEPNFREKYFLIAAHQDWHPGVIGIGASRIVEKYYRPCILFHKEGDTYKGSARSIEGFNLFEALHSLRHLLVKFGGHEMAAGLTVHKDNFEALKEALNQTAQNLLSEDDLIPRIHVDMALEAKQLHFDILNEIDQLEPYGPGNSRPVFIYKRLIVDQRRLLGKNQEHVKLTMHDGSRVFEAIGFRWHDPDRFKPGNLIDLAFTVERNHFNGVESMQLQIKDGRLIDWKHYSDSPSFESYWKSFWRGHQGILVEEVSHADIAEQRVSSPFELLKEDSLVLVWSPEYYEVLLGLKHDGMNLPLHIHFSEAVSTPGINILVNPDLNKLDPYQWAEIAVLGPFPTEKHRRKLISHCKNPIIRYNSSVASVLPDILRVLLPSKEQLAETYRQVRCQGEDLHGSVGILRAKKDVQLWILQENQLIEPIEDGSGYRVLPFTGDRMNILDTEAYRSVMKLRQMAESEHELEKSKFGGTP